MLFVQKSNLIPQLCHAVVISNTYTLHVGHSLDLFTAHVFVCPNCVERCQKDAHILFCVDRGLQIVSDSIEPLSLYTFCC